jgi:hypothetical protein
VSALASSGTIAAFSTEQSNGYTTSLLSRSSSYVTANQIFVEHIPGKNPILISPILATGWQSSVTLYLNSSNKRDKCLEECHDGSEGDSVENSV